MVGEIGQRQTAAKWQQCKKYMLCEGDFWARGLGPVESGSVQTLLVFSARDSNLGVLTISVAFRSIVPKIPGEFGGQEERPPLHCRTTPQLRPRIIFSWSPSACFCSSFLPCLWGRGWFVLKYWLLPNLVINWVLQKDGLDTLFYILPLQNWGCASSSLRSVLWCSTWT